MTTVQELLGAEHVARVGDSVHAVQDVDLEREGLVGTHSSPGPAPSLLNHLTAPAPQLLLPTCLRVQVPFLLQFPFPPPMDFSPLLPGSSPEEGSRGRKETL